MGTCSKRKIHKSFIRSTKVARSQNILCTNKPQPKANKTCVVSHKGGENWINALQSILGFTYVMKISAVKL